MNRVEHPRGRPWLVASILCTIGWSAPGQIRSGPNGHWIQHGGRLLAVVGDSGTQCVMQDLNIDYRRWVDDCAAAGLNAVHVWSFMGPQQQRDGSVLEPRYGYLYPGTTPWTRRKRARPAAHDGWPQWDLRAFDEGTDPKKHYWPRLRDLCRHAKQRNLLVGITVFFGWPKHNPDDWAWHPFNIINGGHLSDPNPIVEVVQHIEQPGHELLKQPWSDAWPSARKTQWLWERFAAKLLRETQPLGNVFYVFMDERSYSEGNCGDHFNRFFKRRGAFWIDGMPRRETVDAVVDGRGPGRDINRIASTAFAQLPARPFFEFELPPYMGAELRRNLYACLLGGGHYFFHDDERQDTVTTGIMSYDPRVRASRPDAVANRQRWLGIACRVLNQQLRDLRGMRPRNELVLPSGTYCLARPGSAYVVYSATGGTVRLKVPTPPREWEVTRINPRTGVRRTLVPDRQDDELVLPLPRGTDWVIVVSL